MCYAPRPWPEHGAKLNPGQRTKSGQKSRAGISPRDQGTAEAQAKRHALVNGAPVELAATASGILYARGHLDRDQLAAAERYARLHVAIFGRTWRQACILGDPAGGAPLDDDRLARMREALDAMHARLTPEQRQAVANVAVFGFVPTWFYAARLGLRELAEDRAAREALVTGLDALVGHHRKPPADDRDAPSPTDVDYIQGERLRQRRLEADP